MTVPVGEIRPEVQKLLDVTQDSLDRGVSAIQTGNRLSDIGHAVQERVEKEEYSVVRTFAGHGIGSKLHEPPWIPNYGAPSRGPRLLPGMVLAIEPMVNAGGPGRADVGRRVDGRDRRRFTLGPLRTHGTRYGRWPGGPDQDGRDRTRSVTPENGVTRRSKANP